MASKHDKNMNIYTLIPPHNKEKSIYIVVGSVLLSKDHMLLIQQNDNIKELLKILDEDFDKKGKVTTLQDYDDEEFVNKNNLKRIVYDKSHFILFKTEVDICNEEVSNLDEYVFGSGKSTRDTYYSQLAETLTTILKKTFAYAFLANDYIYGNANINVYQIIIYCPLDWDVSKANAIVKTENINDNLEMLKDGNVEIVGGGPSLQTLINDSTVISSRNVSVEEIPNMERLLHPFEFKVMADSIKYLREVTNKRINFEVRSSLIRYQPLKELIKAKSNLNPNTHKIMVKVETGFKSKANSIDDNGKQNSHVHDAPEISNTSIDSAQNDDSSHVNKLIEKSQQKNTQPNGDKQRKAKKHGKKVLKQ